MGPARNWSRGRAGGWAGGRAGEQKYSGGKKQYCRHCRRRRATLKPVYRLLVAEGESAPLAEGEKAPPLTSLPELAEGESAPPLTSLLPSELSELEPELAELAELAEREWPAEPPPPPALSGPELSGLPELPEGE